MEGFYPEFEKGIISLVYERINNLYVNNLKNYILFIYNNNFIYYGGTYRYIHV